MTVVTELSGAGRLHGRGRGGRRGRGREARALRTLADVLDDDAVLATTTSSLSVAELAEASGRPDRFGALHVFNPVDKMKLVELAFPDEATDGHAPRLTQLCDELGKTAVEVPDAPGFVVNRLLFPFLFDAVRLAGTRRPRRRRRSTRA